MGMRIKMTKKASVIGHTVPVPIGVVIEAKDESHEAEYKALIQAGYAKETKDKASDEGWKYHVGGNTDPRPTALQKEGKSEPAGFNDEALGEVLAGSVADVAAALDGMDEATLEHLAALEAAGKNRTGVATAIDAAIAALQPAE